MLVDPQPSDLDLSGRWRASVATDELRRTWNDDDFDDADFTDIDVPGHWRLDDAFSANDEPVLYRRRFHSLTLDETQRAWLWVDGLFYQGDVWLDGAYLGDTEGYFAPHHFEISAQLRQRHDHLLGIEVTCTPPGDRNAKRALTGVFQDGPFLDDRWNPGGIWQRVRVRRTGPVAITGSRVLCTEATAQRALVTFRLTLDADSHRRVTLTTTIGEHDHRQSRTLAAGQNQVTWTVPVDEPGLWWPHALGDQPLYPFAVAMHVTDGQPDGKLLDDDAPSDVVQGTIGLRSVAMHDFVLSVNGERLFCKGVNVGPVSPALATVDAAALAGQVDTVVDTGLDLLRVNGHISRPELYDAADRAGLLIWQDLPLQWGYHRSVRRQAARQARAAVDLLAPHPSVAIWCGHNEPDIDIAAVRDGRARGIGRLLAEHELPNWNRSVLDRTLRRALSSADPSRPVVPGAGVWPHPPKLDGTDVHLSLGWRHGELDDLPDLARRIPRVVRFVGEFGSASVPIAADFIDVESWPDLDWERLSRDHGFEADTFERRVPPSAFASFDEWRDATQHHQAHVVRAHVEALRRLKYRPTGGFNAFHLVDARPAISASLIDHVGSAKPALTALRDACAPVIATLDSWPGHLHPGDALDLDVHVINDRHRRLEGATLDVRLWWNDGERRWRFGGDLDADSCTWVGRLSCDVPEAIGPVAVDLVVTAKAHESHHRYTGSIHTH